jgi:hypothetical protein
VRECQLFTVHGTHYPPATVHDQRRAVAHTAYLLLHFACNTRQEGTVVGHCAAAELEVEPYHDTELVTAAEQERGTGERNRREEQERDTVCDCECEGVSVCGWACGVGGGGRVNG